MQMFLNTDLLFSKYLSNLCRLFKCVLVIFKPIHYVNPLGLGGKNPQNHMQILSNSLGGATGCPFCTRKCKILSITLQQTLD